MKTIDEYAIDLVIRGIQHVAEDDLNEDGEIAEADHQAACDLALRLAAAIEVNPEALLALVAAEDLVKLRDELGKTLDTMQRLQVENEASGLFVGALAYQGAAELVRTALRGGDAE